MYGAGLNADKQVCRINKTKIDKWTLNPPSEFNNEKIIQVACGSCHTMFLSESGTLYGIGYNSTNQVMQSSSVPPQLVETVTKIDLSCLKGSPMISSIGCSAFASFFITRENEFYMVGNIAYASVKETQVLQNPAMTGVKTVKASSQSLLLVKERELIIDINETIKTVPLKGLQRVTTFACSSEYYICALETVSLFFQSDKQKKSPYDCTIQFKQ